jgi:chromosome segregation ATPase
MRNIKTWQKRLTPDGIDSVQDAMQSEISELRAALAELDAEIEGWRKDQKENLRNQVELQQQINTLRTTAQQELESAQKLPTNCGTNYCSCIECFRKK